MDKCGCGLTRRSDALLAAQSKQIDPNQKRDNEFGAGRRDHLEQYCYRTDDNPSLADRKRELLLLTKPNGGELDGRSGWNNGAQVWTIKLFCFVLYNIGRQNGFIGRGI